jgi:long-chain acyl-CoA synthetase
MKSLNGSKQLFHLNGIIMEDNGNIHYVKSILEDAASFFLSIPARSLVLLLCQNSFDSVSFYVNCIDRDIVPILVDADSDSSLIESLVNIYEPTYIFAPIDKGVGLDNYVAGSNFRSYNAYKIKKQNQVSLYPELALLLSTSGTTGSPKLVRLSYNNLVANASSIAEYLKLNSSERAISSLPMNYSFGLSIINSHLHVGASILMTRESITQRRFWDLFKQFNITSLSGVPYTFEILKKFRLLNTELPSLKTITQAGGKLSNDLIAHFADYSSMKEINFFVMYGQTEGTARLSYLPPKFVLKKLGSIGRPIPGGNFHLIDEQGVKINEPGISGELVYSGDNVMLGYAECKEDLSLSDVNQGVLVTGDLAQFDEDGFFYIVGRTKRFIKLLGNRVNLDELERLLIEINIQSACCGKDNFLLVYILDVNEKVAVKELLTKRLGIHFTIFDIRVIDSFPRNASGKIVYSKLVD